MNLAEAKEILKHPFKEGTITTSWDADLYLDGKAKGYLEAFSLAEKLADALNKISSFCHIHKSECGRYCGDHDFICAYRIARQALSDFEKAKGNL